MMEEEPVDNGGGETEQRNGGGGDKADVVVIREYAPGALFAPMPVERNALYYNMNHKKRGIAIIFNHETFDEHLSLSPRTGTNQDSNNLNEVFKSLGFSVTVLDNRTASEVHNYLQQIAEIDHTDNDCLLIAVLTHGDYGLLYAKDTHYKPNNLWYHFTADKCPSLAGKPKLFFIQACQGDNMDRGITLNRTEHDGISLSSYKIPIHADFLIVCSTIAGYLSWRHTSRGSWFMQALCDELRYAGTERDILTLLTVVIQKVALDFESDRLQKQVPCTTSMLTRLLVFGKKQ